MDNDTPIGKRIRYYRKRRGMSQATLAEQVDRSESWLQKVEAGDLVMDSISVLLALARVLKVGPWELLPKLGLPPNGGAPMDAPRGIHALRHALFAPVDRDPPTLEELHADLAAAKRLKGAGSYEPLAIVLPELVLSARAADTAGTRVTAAALTGVYQTAYTLTCDLGELDLALLATDRAVQTAHRADDPTLYAAARRQSARVLMQQGWLDEAAAVCSDTADTIAPSDNSALAHWAVWGSLLLREALAHARRQDPFAARRLLDTAKTAAERVGPGRWESAFGPANVVAHEVAATLELGDPVEALRLAEGLDVDELPTAGRRATVLLDIAQAYGLRRDDAAAVSVLARAEQESPQTVRYSVLAHELVRACLKREQRHRTPALRGLADRLGVAA